MGTQHTPEPPRLGKYIVGIEDDADAALISAAPNLLAALRAMLEDYRSEGCPDPTCGVCERSKAAKSAALAAIAKAEWKG